jgi:hypothetical protein
MQEIMKILIVIIAGLVIGFVMGARVAVGY